MPEGISILNFPSVSVIPPVTTLFSEVDFSVMVAYSRGMFVPSSITFPSIFMSFCAKDNERLNNRITNKVKFNFTKQTYHTNKKLFNGNILMKNNHNLSYFNDLPPEDKYICSILSDNFIINKET